jgi:hypothetical protein
MFPEPNVLSDFTRLSCQLVGCRYYVSRLVHLHWGLGMLGAVISFVVCRRLGYAICSSQI